MKNIKIVQKILGFKGKKMTLQKKMTDMESVLERNEEKEIFEVYKSIIETELEQLDFEIFNLEACLEFTEALANGGCVFRSLDDSDYKKMVQEQMRYSEKFIKPSFKKIESQIVRLEDRLKSERMDLKYDYIFSNS